MMFKQDGMFPHTITIYNKHLVQGVEKWQRTVVAGVFWNSSKGAIIRKTGVATADGLTLIIPLSTAGQKYKKPKVWEALTDKSGYWTIQAGDTVVLGEVTTAVTKSAKELQIHEDVLLVTVVDTKEYGFGMRHLEVTGR